MKIYHKKAVRASITKFESYTLLNAKTGETLSITQGQALQCVNEALTIYGPGEIHKKKGALLRFMMPTEQLLLYKNEKENKK